MTVTLAVLALAGLLPMLVVALINLAAAPRLHRVSPEERGAGVSVLVPARDEADNLLRLLPALAACPYEPLEIVVLDDGSGDDTAAVVRRAARLDPRIRLVTGLAPPSGWTGKNWACHQLAGQARGDTLLFCDADVVPSPEAVGRTVAALRAADADVLTALPRQRTGSWVEGAVVPLVVQLPLTALLPLPLVRRTRTVSLSVGNGQWLAWRRTAYKALGGHARVRDDVLEDVRLARLAKSAGLRVAAYVAPRDLAVRMYDGGDATWQGFAKNLYPLLGGRGWSLALALAVFLVVAMAPLLLPLTAPGGPWMAAPLLALVALRLASAGLFEGSPASILLHPVGAVLVCGLALASWSWHRSGTVRWKRRILIPGDRT